MQRADKRILLALALLVAGLHFAVGFALTRPTSESWKIHAEGLLAIPTPCCSEASLWESLDEVSEDGQRPRPATAVEAARWLNDWPYGDHDEAAFSEGEPLEASVKNMEVRCVGTPTGPEIVPRTGSDAYTLESIRLRRECVFTKWRVWSQETTATTAERLHERHTVWAGEDGFFRGRVDYWR
jgi:hypothetical protein